MLTLTESAESAIGRFVSGAETPVAGLRIAVTGGGCSGLQYSMNLVAEGELDDFEITCGSVRVFVEAMSAPLLRDVVVDFVDDINGSGFKFENPNASAACACGKSFAA